MCIAYKTEETFLLQLRLPIKYVGGNMEVCLEFHLKFSIHGILRQYVTNHQILMQISIVSTNRHRCQHILLDWEFFYDQKFNMAAAKLEVVSNIEINSIAENFRRISPILLDMHVAEIIAERLIHNGTCKIQNGGKNRK
jgi:hypothetical protein